MKYTIGSIIVGILFAALICIAFPARADTLSDPFKVVDISMEAAYDLELIADSHQTHAAQAMGGTEHNALLGEHPGHAKATNYFIGTALLHGAISYMLPRPWRESFQGISIIYEGGVIHRNDLRGFGFNFRL